MSDSKETFDWKGSAGDEFSAWNPSDAKGTDKNWMEYYGRLDLQRMSLCIAIVQRSKQAANQIEIL